jgi:hypothetical protein
VRKGLDRRLWELLAYAARYGKQPLSEARALPLTELARFVTAISNIVLEERKETEED